MKITICGSIAFIDDMLKVQQELEALGHEVKTPPTEITDKDGNPLSVKDYYKIRKAADAGEQWVWDRKAEAIRRHFDKIDWADAILVLNYDKNGIQNYIGANTFLEIGVAFYKKQPIYLLNPIPKVDFVEELLGMKPTVLNGDLTAIAS